MGDAYIIDAVRSPTGRRGGSLSDVHPADLGAHVLGGLVDRVGVDPGEIDDVIFGCVGQIGAQAWNVGRTAWLSAGLPESVPAVTIDRQCGSSQQAVHFAAQGVMAGTYDLAVAGGVEVMSLVPISANGDLGPGLSMRHPLDGEGWIKRYGEGDVTQFRGAEMLCTEFGISRRDMEELALSSHQRAAAAWDSGRFGTEVLAFDGFETDEGVRRDTSIERMAELSPLAPGGRITAALASQISDGAAALLIASDTAVKRLGLTPMARIRAMAVTGGDPIMMLAEPIASTAKVLDRAGMTIDDIDLFECNEAFASVVLAWAKETGAPLRKTNVNGGAMSLGHPLGASGAKLMTTLVHELNRRQGRFGLQTMCEGGGLSNATIIERVG